MNTMRVERGGPPAHAETQRERVLQILRHAGARGVRRDTFIYEYRVTQPGARVSELQQEGFMISSAKAHPEDEFVTYYLRSEPAVRKYVPRYTKKQTGHPRRSLAPTKPDHDLGPLFSSTRDNRQ
jgi:hypothetical protein